MAALRTSDELITQLGLQIHPEGGYFVETDRQSNVIPSPFAGEAPRSLATSIYYLLTKDSPSGNIHMNKSITYHILHQGRAEYTLITPGSPQPKIEKKIMGTNIEAGETRLLLVGTGVWKMSKLLSQDLNDKNRVEEGCLITEVVVPGFHWEDHEFLTMEGLKKLFEGVEGGEAIVAELSAHVRSK